MGLAVVTLKKGEGRFLKSGGMWVFDNEIASVMGSFVNGDIVLVHDFDGYPLGRGFINRNSKITIRLLTRNENQKIDEDFFEKRVRDAWEYRKKVTDTSSCRVIFGEADFFPGLVVDKLEDVLVVQSLALGIDRWKELILDLIDYDVEDEYEEDDEEGTITIYGNPKSYAAIQKHLEECGFEDVGGDFTYIPNDMKEVTPEQRETLDKMIERLDVFYDVPTLSPPLHPLSLYSFPPTFPTALSLHPSLPPYPLFSPPPPPPPHPPPSPPPSPPPPLHS